MPQRRDYIDELKGLGILLVVLGHFIEQYRMGYSFVSASFFCIYAFHMALFCICSGLVARWRIAGTNENNLCGRQSLEKGTAAFVYSTQKCGWDFCLTFPLLCNTI